MLIVLRRSAVLKSVEIHLFAVGVRVRLTARRKSFSAILINIVSFSTLFLMVLIFVM